MKTVAVVDLGTTKVKAAVLDTMGCAHGPVACDSPSLRRAGLRVTSDPGTWVRTVLELLMGLPAKAWQRLALISQRSSFLLWREDTGRPLTPVISWLDRRAAAWCASRRDGVREIEARTGLHLSSHYAGPKLAVLLEKHADWRRMAQKGALRFGTLDTYLIWCLTEGRQYGVDPTMAARTLLFDPETSDWSPELLQWFGVPRCLLPSIRPSRFGPTPSVFGWRICASLSDQAASAVSVFRALPHSILIHGGTGVFVMRAQPGNAPKGYLSAVAPSLAPVPPRIWEGAVHSGASLVARISPDRDEPPAFASREGFCMPDENGWGAPFWQARQCRCFSDAAASASDGERDWYAFEGLIFRVCMIAEDFGASESGLPVVLSGGLSAHPVFGVALASALNRQVLIPNCRELGLVGGALMAGNLGISGVTPLREVDPGAAFSYLRERYGRWREWLDSRAASPS